jgi:transglutaminase-like putative cysteine protease
MVIKYAAIIVFVFMAGVPLYALPATLTLPPGPRPGVEELTIEQAAQQLDASGKKGWDLVEAARSLVAERMAYSRRNSFDSAGRAFERGYGYCTQHAFALSHLLTELGFEARVVQAFQNRFPEGQVTAHAWVSVNVGGETRQVDSLFYDQENRALDFTPLSEITDVTPAFKLVAFWGGTAVNAHRYYLSGKDF